MFDEPRIEHGTADYSHFNFAMLHGSGPAHIFNFMRYNSAFLARQTDLQHLLEAASDYGDWLTRRYAILICRYDWKGPTRANWQQGMLLSDQELMKISNLHELYELNSDFTTLRPPKKLKVQHVCTLSGPVSWILQTMYDNQACPYEEGDASTLEHAMWTQMSGASKDISVRLVNYRALKTMWRIPPRVATCDHERAQTEGYVKCPVCGDKLRDTE